MRKSIALGIAFLIMLALTQCVEKTSEPFTEPLGDTISLNDTVSMRVGGKVTVLPDGIEMGFDRVIEDSRCPYEYDCFQPGKGVVRLRLRKPGSDDIVVNTGLYGSYTSDPAGNENLLIPADTFGCRFSLVALSPYPINFDPIPQDEYLARIRVTRLPDNDPAFEAVIITDQPPDSIELDDFMVDEVNVSGDTLILEVSMSGGCKHHSFELYMSPSAFAESNPVQAFLYLRHNSKGDLCSAWIWYVLKFDLRPVADLYYHQYGGLDTVRINVMHFPFEDGQMTSVLYVPTAMQ